LLTPPSPTGFLAAPLLFSLPPIIHHLFAHGLLV
jgi:hypothetical protein